MSRYDVEVKIEGLDELCSKLDGMAKNVLREVAVGALIDGVDIVSGEISAGAPTLQDFEKAPHVPGGFLRDHQNNKDNFHLDETGCRVLVNLTPENIYYPARKPEERYKSGKKKGELKRKWLKALVRLQAVIGMLEYGVPGRPGVKNPFWTRGFEASKQKALDAIVKALVAGVNEEWKKQ